MAWTTVLLPSQIDIGISSTEKYPTKLWMVDVGKNNSIIQPVQFHFVFIFIYRVGYMPTSQSHFNNYTCSKTCLFM